MSGVKRNSTIVVDEKVKLKIGSREYVFKANTPTNHFLNDVADEITATSNTSKVSKITAIQVIDTAGEPGATITFEDWELVKTQRSITISGSATWNSDNPPSKLRIMSVNNYAYFETNVPAGGTAQRGLLISVTWDALFSFNMSNVSGFLSGSTLNDTQYTDLLTDILSGTRGNRFLTIRMARFEYVGGHSFSVNTSNNNADRYIVVPQTRVARAGQINIVRLCNSTNQ
jgi:hypothetical protein